MADHLTSLKRKHSSDAAVSVSGEDFFPHTMYLNDEEIQKLGVGSLELGDEREFIAVVRVTSVSSREDDEDGKTRDMTLTIIEGEISSSTRSRSERIFGGKKDGDN